MMLKRAADFLKRKGESVHPLGADVGPTFVRLKVELRGDADFARVRKQAENLKLHLALGREPLIASQAGYVSIDVLNPNRQTVFLPPLLAQCPPRLAGRAGRAGRGGRVRQRRVAQPERAGELPPARRRDHRQRQERVPQGGARRAAARLEPTQLQFRLIDPKRVTFNVPTRARTWAGRSCTTARRRSPSSRSA
jgi:S-DNA-T family DNA segregation ATPase FtsK/SpoIIIE